MKPKRWPKFTYGQKKHLQKAYKEHMREQPKLKELRDRLLGLGGKEIVPCREEDIDKILKRGILCKGRIKMMPALACRCHANSAALWDQNHNTTKLVTGWACSKDGLWRQHSWCLWEGKIVETTTKRVMYFGFVMTKKEAKQFYRENGP